MVIKIIDFGINWKFIWKSNSVIISIEYFFVFKRWVLVINCFFLCFGCLGVFEWMLKTNLEHKCATENEGYHKYYYESYRYLRFGCCRCYGSPKGAQIRELKANSCWDEQECFRTLSPLNGATCHHHWRRSWPNQPSPLEHRRSTQPTTNQRR